MRKFMKAIAFVTVMCLVLSTVAFAAAEVTDYSAKKVQVTVEDVAKGEQVAIIITSHDNDYDFTTDTILFVDQKAATSDTALFEAEITDASVTAIDIYAGYASNEGVNAVKVGNDIPIVQETKLTLVTAQVVDDITEVTDKAGNVSTANPGTKGSLVYLKLNATNVAAGDLTQMWWAFHVSDNSKADSDPEKNDTKYSIGDVAGLGLGTVLTGDVEIAAAFESTGYTVKGANAIFLLKGEDVHTAEGDLLEEIKGDKIEK
ncbi:MAG: hypothetical protein IJD91_05655 [Clostridia bacterium]|nr:hypothetical protein [Clostridia bacterium]